MSPKPRSTEDTVREYFAALAARDAETAAACWHPDGEDHFYGLETLHGPDGVRGYFTELFRSFPDFEFRVLDIVTEGQQSAVRWRATATFSGDAKFQGLAPTGANLDFEGMDMLTVSEGLITDNRAYLNATELARQLGAMPPAGSIADKAMLSLVNATSAPKRILRRVRG
jgi:predicted ester cyclase